MFICSNRPIGCQLLTQKTVLSSSLSRFFAFLKTLKTAYKLDEKSTSATATIDPTEVSLLEAQQQQQQPLISGLPAPYCHPSPAELLI